MILEMVFVENKIWIGALGFRGVAKKLQRLATEGPYCSDVIPVGCWKQAVLLSLLNYRIFR